jgi:hypothetical protein
MATTSYGTPMTMGMTAGMGSQPMTTTGLQAGVVRNMNLPLSRATPIQVTETTPNLEEIQNFPVAGRGLDGTHFHQDPVSGQMYVMTDEFHQRIPEILSNKKIIMNGGTITPQTITMGTSNTSVIPIIQMDGPTVDILYETSTATANDSINNIFNKLSAPNIFFDGMIGELEKNKFIDFSYSDRYITQNRYIETNLDLMNQIDQKSYDLKNESLFMNRLNDFKQPNVFFPNTEKNIPINRFFIQSVINTAMVDGVNYYTPINRFYNQ